VSGEKASRATFDVDAPAHACPAADRPPGGGGLVAERSRAVRRIIGSDDDRASREAEHAATTTATLRYRRPARLAAAIALVGLATGCGGSSASSTSSSTGTSTASRTWSIVALGDSVPSGYNCDCTPYPQLSAQGLTSSAGQTVTAANDAVAGYTTTDVLHQLNADSAVIDHVRKADAIEINIGANDVPYNTNSCGTSVDCYAPFVGPMQENLAAIVSRVRSLTSGHKVLVVLLDYWSVWLGGTYARDKGHAYVSAARRMTNQVDEAIKTTASQSGAAYVSERRAFKGPSFGYVESHYLATDGEHPNAAGHQAIAAAAEDVITETLHP
jgi:lysophospholipase L1-like esterase